MANTTVRKLLEKARRYFESGKLLHSIQIYHKLINEYPDFVSAYVELAFVYMKLSKEIFAERLLRQAYMIDPENEEVIFMLGNVCLRLGKFNEAEELFTKLAHLEYPTVHYNLGLSYYHTGDYLKAEAEFKKVLKIDPEFPKVVELLAQILIERGSYEEAYEYLNQRLKKEPYNYVLRHLLAISLRNMRRLDEAKREIELAIDLEPGDGSLWETCGEILLELGEIDEAEIYFRRAVEIDKNLANSFINLGLIYAYRGKLDEANKFFGEAIKIDPNASFKIDEKLKLFKNA